MHPDIGDLIQGIKRALANEVLPAVTTPFAREQLAYTLFLCEHLAARWDRAHSATAEEYSDLRATLASAVDMARRCNAPAPEFAALVDATGVTLATEDVGGRPLRDVTAAIKELRERIAQFVAACANGDGADQTVLAEIRTALRGFMKRQLARDEEWVSVSQIGWWD